MASPTSHPAAAELRYDLKAELEMVRRPGATVLNGRATRTLVSEGPLRVTLVSMEPGGSMARHEAAVPTVVQPLEGEVLVTAGERRHALHAGELLSLGPHVPHSVESRTGGSFLLTVVLPPTAD